MSCKILLVEDEADIANVILNYLQAAGWQTQLFSGCAGVVDYVRQQTPQVMLLDLNLPDGDGISVCQQIRQFSDIPIIITSARVEEMDRLLGLELGADDYVCKPYSAKELVARVRVQLKRLQPSVANTAAALQLDADTLTLRYQQQQLQLSLVEFKLLQLLLSSPHRIYSRDQIIDRLYQQQRDLCDRTVDSHIRNLRRRLQQLNLNAELIQSVYGAGYKYQPIAS